MAKHIALHAYVEIDNVTFNDGEVRAFNLVSEDEQVDASGFNVTGNNETLQGNRARSLELEFFTDRAAGQMAQVLYPLHRDRLTFDVSFRENMNAAVSATNPEWRGECILPQWNESATRGEVETTTLVFVSQGDDGLERYYT